MKYECDKPVVKNLEKFEKDFIKLLAKYPGVMVFNNVRGDLMASQSGKIQSYSIKLPSYNNG